MEYDYTEKSIFTDQYNIPWQILDKRATMIASFSNYSMKLMRYRAIDQENKNTIISCIVYLFSELNSLKLKKIKAIKKNEEDFLISYEEAVKIYKKHIYDSIEWTHSEIMDMFYFILEMCRVSGISDIGYTKRDSGRAILGDS